ncbi:MAG: hypothetical protein HC763_25605 [Hydrococcus sp. CRU_1_1]|nr:hypothetical protein [Hydrococcus sp. CRU_1_1]
MIVIDGWSDGKKLPMLAAIASVVSIATALPVWASENTEKFFPLKPIYSSSSLLLLPTLPPLQGRKSREVKLLSSRALNSTLPKRGSN